MKLCMTVHIVGTDIAKCNSSTMNYRRFINKREALLLLDCLNNQIPLSGTTEDSKASGFNRNCCNFSLRYKYDRKQPNIFRLEKHPLYDPVLSI